MKFLYAFCIVIAIICLIVGMPFVCYAFVAP